MEMGFWPLADIRIAVGYNFRDTRDPLGRDLQGRDKGVYLTLSTKLSRPVSYTHLTLPTTSRV